MLVGCKLAGGVFGSVARPCLGIDVQSPDSAPTGEAFRVDYGSENLETIAFELCELFQRLCMPFFEVSGEDISIRHDQKDFRIVGFLKPADADSASCDRDAANV